MQSETAGGSISSPTMKMMFFATLTTCHSTGPNESNYQIGTTRIELAAHMTVSCDGNQMHTQPRQMTMASKEQCTLECVQNGGAVRAGPTTDCGSVQVSFRIFLNSQ